MSMVTRPGVTFVMGTMFGALITRVAMTRRFHHHEGEGRQNRHCPRKDLGKKTSANASASASPGAAEENYNILDIRRFGDSDLIMAKQIEEAYPKPKSEDKDVLQ
ncbi:hypothetical protein CMV_010779 [Castanea mollissima]|uniref:Uncharacterized protein n=1 Tax=Castanea mollissima TaxID=60419 RepID=A0A8J4R6F7_9ROSI|nr:hypothetical protein CMV_010779 [Castanea mollissima]